MPRFKRIPCFSVVVNPQPIGTYGQPPRRDFNQLDLLLLL